MRKVITTIVLVLLLFTAMAAYAGVVEHGDPPLQEDSNGDCEVYSDAGAKAMPNNPQKPENVEIQLCDVDLEIPEGSGLANAKVAAEYTNGIVINPGAEFSFNDSVGERTRDRGFVEGIIIDADGEGGYHYRSAVGGGVCLTSTAIHKAVLEAPGLEVLERHSHSLTVGYAKHGQDAAVSWDSWDYRFQNNRDNPVKLASEVNGNIFNVKIVDIGPGGQQAPSGDPGPVIVVGLYSQDQVI